MESCPKEAFIGAYNAGIEEENDYIVDGEFLELQHLQQTIQNSLGLSSCSTCGGMEVDLSNGRLYCGLAVPPGLLEQNERILDWDEE